ncbi:MAG: hypothetical protein JST76_01705 [Bacteroidetes bacterium]|nr:hypothetical protein [Bacteroidota bacterium]
MKNLLYIAILILLSGCAKVTQEGQACANPPTASAIADTVVSLNEDLHFTASTSSGATIRWTKPDGTTSTSYDLQVDAYDSTKYGTYTYTAISGVCTGATHTFQVLANHTGAPTCTIAPADYNKLTLSDGHTLLLSGTATSGISGNHCAYAYNEIHAVDNSYDVYINTYDAPAPGGYYQLDSVCPGTAGSVVINLDLSTGSYGGYYSLSGQMYCNIIGSQKYLTFCNATLRRINNNAQVTITGSIAIP